MDTPGMVRAAIVARDMNAGIYPSSRVCACMGPQNGEPECPCRMQCRRYEESVEKRVSETLRKGGCNVG